MRLPCRISIHALREEGDGTQVIGTCLGMIFLSTPSARRATVASVTGKHRVLFLSTPSARRATSGDRGLFLCAGISIHALREEGDAGGFDEARQNHGFLSTPSARRATLAVSCTSPTRSNFYPRPLRGGRRMPTRLQDASREISIHALREEGDFVCRGSSAQFWNFYPRPPRGGRLASRSEIS